MESCRCRKLLSQIDVANRCRVANFHWELGPQLRQRHDRYSIGTAMSHAYFYNPTFLGVCDPNLLFTYDKFITNSSVYQRELFKKLSLNI